MTVHGFIQRYALSTGEKLRVSRLFWLALFLLFFLPQVPRAQLIDLRDGDQKKEETAEVPFLTLGGGIVGEALYDSNVFKTRYNAEDDFYFAIQPQVTLQMAYRALSLDISYQPKFVFFTKFFDDENLDTLIQNLKFSMVLVAAEYFQIELRDNLGATKYVYSGLDTPDNLLMRNELNPRIIFSYPLTPRWNIETIGDFIRVDIENPGKDYIQFGASLSNSYELTPSLALLAGGGAAKTYYDDPGLVPVVDVHGEAGLGFEFFQRLKGKILGRYEHVFVGNLNDGSFGGIVHVDYEITETTTVYAQAERKFGINQTANVVTETLLSGGLRQQLGARTTLQGEGYYNLFDIPAFSPVNDRLWGANVELLYEITEKLMATARYEYNTNIGPTTFNDFNDHIVSLGLRYDFGQIFTIF